MAKIVLTCVRTRTRITRVRIKRNTPKDGKGAGKPKADRATTKNVT